ncbi:MAG: hypothetical protein RJB60_2690 [Pseudomonadota bacterium]|jgi:hypothetical protein
MAIGWLTVLKAVPWTEVISNAPKITEGAKKLWKSAAGKQPGAATGTAATVTEAAPGVAPFAEWDQRLAGTEAKLAELHAQMRASAEIIQALSEQNAQLIQRIEQNAKRTQWLGIASILACLTAGASLTMAWVN